MADDIRDRAIEAAEGNKQEAVASLDAATINAMADAAAELPVALLHGSAHDEATSFALTGLALLANARRSRVNIGDRMVAVLLDLQERAEAAAQRAGETQPRAKG